MKYRLMAACFMLVLALGFSGAVAEEIGGVSSDSAKTVAAAQKVAESAAKAADATPNTADVAADSADPANPEGAPLGEGADSEDDAGKTGGFHPIFLIGAVVLIFLLFMNPGKKAEKKRKEMLANLKKNDRVTTIGGIVGTVLNVRDNDVTIKVDENTKMKIARWAIRVVGAPEGDDEPQDNR